MREGAAGMERIRLNAGRRRLLLFLGAGTAAVFLLRRALLALGMQLAAAAVLMLLALPLCRMLEKRLPPSAAALTSLLLLGAGAAALLMTLLPPLFRQLTQLAEDLPGLLAWLKGLWQHLSDWLKGRGMDMTPIREELFAQVSRRMGDAVTGLANMLRKAFSSAGRMMLAPLLSFYLLRDRKRIAAGLTLLLPVAFRTRGVRAAREMRRETAAFFRGQLLLSLAVGVLTALGLLLTGTPGWLLLGLLMGVMELIPYIGPFIAGIPAVLLALQNGWIRALWTLAVLFAVQQIEGTILSPRLLAGATQLHPMAVLLLVSAGGILAGPLGMVAVIPAVVSVRGALRGWRE